MAPFSEVMVLVLLILGHVAQCPQGLQAIVWASFFDMSPVMSRSLRLLDLLYTVCSCGGWIGVFRICCKCSAYLSVISGLW